MQASASSSRSAAQVGRRLGCSETAFPMENVWTLRYPQPVATSVLSHRVFEKMSFYFHFKLNSDTFGRGKKSQFLQGFKVQCSEQMLRQGDFCSPITFFKTYLSLLSGVTEPSASTRVEAVCTPLPHPSLHTAFCTPPLSAPLSPHTPLSEPPLSAHPLSAHPQAGPTDHSILSAPFSPSSARPTFCPAASKSHCLALCLPSASSSCIFRAAFCTGTAAVLRAALLNEVLYIKRIYV